MSDRIKALTVYLENDFREDDLEPVIEAISMIRGVLKVQGHPADITDGLAMERARQYLGEQVLAIIYPNLKKFGT